MNKKNNFLLQIGIIISIILLIFFKINLKFKNKIFKTGSKMIFQATNVQEVKQLFASNVQEINHQTKKIKEIVQKEVEQIIQEKNPSFDTIAKKLDTINYYYMPIHASFHALEILSPDKEIREAVHEKIIDLTNFMIDKLSSNKQLYSAFKNYALNFAPKEVLTDDQKYFIDQTLKDFTRSGLDLPDQELQKVADLTKEIAQISLNFESNIAKCSNKILVTEQQLEGVDKTLIESLPKDKEGKIILGCDYPTYYAVMDNCKVAQTRKELYLAFQNRAYPENMQLLDKLIEKRAKFAEVLGFESYCHFSLDNQMAKSPSKVIRFLDKLIDKAKVKLDQELNILKKDLPKSVQLTSEGKIQPWDIKFLKNYYKNKYLNIDNQEIAKYFPMENTVKKLLHIYEEFFNIEFKTEIVNGLWVDNLEVITAYDKDTYKLLGFIILDLYPRENKYSHAAHTTIVSTVCDQKKQIPSVGIVIANFPKSTAQQPSLLKYNDVVTFFHEFGHAIHAMLGCTKLQSFSGTNVKTDFVEMPSQMLEDWMQDKEILKMVSSHYQTGQSLPEDIINKIIQLERFDSGDFVLTQIYYALMSINYYLKDKVDTQKISEKLFKELLSHIQWSPDSHMQASFGHLTSYGPCYYGYMWSKVYAKDLFAQVKKAGLLNPEIGQKYRQMILAKGGSKDPNLLLKEFLGREPEETAFFANLGL